MKQMDKMKKYFVRSMLAAFAGAFLLIAYCNNTEEATHKNHTTHTLHWDYSTTAGTTGPDNWFNLEAAYSACEDTATSKQSPIDIITTPVALPVLNPASITARTYSATGPTDWSVENNGHTVQVNYPAGSSITINGVTYDLVQFHFHSTSEHLIDGNSYALEMHMVHQNAANGDYAVVALLFDDNAGAVAADQTFLASILTEFNNLGLGSGNNSGWPLESEAPSSAPFSGSTAIDVSTVFPGTLGYYTYTGSLTTPPCTEAVKEWVIFDTVQGVTAQTVADFLAAIGGQANNRPTQNLNGRTVSTGTSP